MPKSATKKKTTAKAASKTRTVAEKTVAKAPAAAAEKMPAVATPAAERPTFKMPNIEMPKFINTTQLMVVVMIVGSFFLGSLYTKVQYLEKNGGVLGAAAPADPNAAGAQPQATPAQKVDVGVGHFPMMGKSDAKVTIVEFADFRCPFCQQFFLNTEPQIIKDYVDTGKAKIYFRQYPFLGPASNVAADAAECANDQGKFWPFHDYLYKNQPAESDTSMYNTDGLTKIATSLGMNGNTFRTCLDGKKDDAKANQDLTEGQKAGVTGTPAFFINGMPLVGAQPYAAFKAQIDTELSK